MTPESIEERKRAGLALKQEDMLWLVDLCETLAKGLASLGVDDDFRCKACGSDPETGHGRRCPVPLADAVLAGRWKVS
jgi:hypothetical protein